MSDDEPTPAEPTPPPHPDQPAVPDPKPPERPEPIKNPIMIGNSADPKNRGVNLDEGKKE